MRGSLKTQLTAALKTISRIGYSRHAMKRYLEGRSPLIHSIGTLEKNFERLNPLATWLKLRGIRDLELLTTALAAEYLAHRAEFHHNAGHSPKTFVAELSAFAALERGLTVVSAQYRRNSIIYDFQRERDAVRATARKQVCRQRTRRQSRALENPEAVVAALGNPKHQIMARLQLECGCRAEGVGAPRRWHNPLRYANFCGRGLHAEKAHPTQNEPDALLPLIADPVTDEMCRPFWTKEKGGKVATKYCPLPLADKVLQWLDGGRRELFEDYVVYLAAINKAMAATGQSATGRGTHALRFCFAQRRYRQCLRHGMSDEQAKEQVSHEMSHNRPDITEIYL